MSPRRRRLSRRRRNALIGGGVGLAGAAVIAVIAIAQTGGTEDLIPPSGGVGDTEIVRIDLQAARDLDTSTPCDLPAGGASDNKPLVADQTWTRTGGESCYPISATAAQCFDATEVPYTVDATGLGWVTEGDSTNRILFSTAIDCTNWSCTGTAAATPMQVAPDGSATASVLSVGAYTVDDIYSAASGYTADAVLYPRIWIQCSSGTLVLRNTYGGTHGLWDVTCATASGGDWALINSGSQTGVSESYAWEADGLGRAGFRIYASSGTVDATAWTPTLTEEAGTDLSVIPTVASAVATGDISWMIDNSGGNYYKVGDTVTQTITEISGTCWVVDGSNLRLSGATGSPCTGIWYALQVSR